MAKRVVLLCAILLFLASPVLAQIVANDGTDQAENINQAMNALVGKIGVVELPQGVIHFSQLKIKRNACLKGVGAGSATPPHIGTLLVHLGGFGDAIVSDPNLPTNEYMHWGCLEGFTLITNGGETGIKFNHAVGEHYRINNVTITKFQTGLWFAKGGSPAFIEDVNVSGNLSYGIRLEPNPGVFARYRGFKFKNISCDSNGVACVYMEKAGTTDSEHIDIDGIKAETTKAGMQQCVVMLKNQHYAGVTIHGVNAMALGEGIGPNPSIVCVYGPWNGTASLSGVGWQGYAYALDRPETNERYPVSVLRGGRGFRYSSNGTSVY